MIGGFRGGAEGTAAPLFRLYFQNVLRFCVEHRFIKCSLILSSETLTLLYFASRIRPQCCMLHVLKSEVFIRGGGGGGDSTPLSKFSGSAPVIFGECSNPTCSPGKIKCLSLFNWLKARPSFKNKLRLQTF